jgi:hypothetical protein
MNNFTLVNCDTDSISFCKPDQSPFTEDEQANLLAELNSLYPSKIHFEHDGVFETVCILKAKNYILKAYVCKKCKKSGLKTCGHDEAKLTKKGSSLKSSKTEPALKEFMGEIINSILARQPENIKNIYFKYVAQICSLKDISPWSSKKTITKSILNPERTNEQKVLDAFNGRSFQMGDKIYTYFAEERTMIQEKRYRKNRKTGEQIETIVEKEVVTNPVRLVEDWDPNKPDHAVDLLLKRLYNTLVIFENVINMKQFPKYYLKGMKEELEASVRLLDEDII